MTILLPVILLFRGQVSVFYIIYLYWWHELISIGMDVFYASTKRKDSSESLLNPLRFQLLTLAIYLSFILIVEGCMNVVNEKEWMKRSADVFYFRNLMFNFNMIILLLNEWWVRHFCVTQRNAGIDLFSKKMIVWHWIIMLGWVMFFSVLHWFPDMLTTPHRLEILLLGAGFLILKTYLLWCQHTARRSNKKA